MTNKKDIQQGQKKDIQQGQKKDIQQGQKKDIQQGQKKDFPPVLKKPGNWSALYIYQKSAVVYQLSYAFCERFIHLFKDRTRDQVIQAARSCKQNIVEGLEDGMTSSEMQLKLLNVARASLMELKEDYKDYLNTRFLRTYVKGEDEYDQIVDFCRYHNKLEDYESNFYKWSDEVMCNYALSLCHFIDKMLMSLLEKLEREFVTEGGIKERMYRARTGYRNMQDERIKQQDEQIKQKEEKIRQKDERISQLETEINNLNNALSEANSKITGWIAKYEDLKERALKAYYSQKEEIEALKAKISKSNELLE